MVLPLSHRVPSTSACLERTSSDTYHPYSFNRPNSTSWLDTLLLTTSIALSLHMLLKLEEIIIERHHRVQEYPEKAGVAEVVIYAGVSLGGSE